MLYGGTVTKTFKTFLATYPPAGARSASCWSARPTAGWPSSAPTPRRPWRRSWRPWPTAPPSNRTSTTSKRCMAPGQQQVRHYWANVAVYHLNLWLHTLIELWAWDRPQGRLCDRSDSPWDDPDRRPSHADRRNALRRQCLRRKFKRLRGAAVSRRNSVAPVRRLLSLVVWA